VGPVGMVWLICVDERPTSVRGSDGMSRFELVEAPGRPVQRSESSKEQGLAPQALRVVSTTESTELDRCRTRSDEERRGAWHPFVDDRGDGVE
jgi:hypothetical protein